MKKQRGMSAIKLILIIVLAILIASFVGCVGNFLFAGAVVKGVGDALHEKQPIATTLIQKPIILPAKPAYTDENQRRMAENQRKLDEFAQQQRQIKQPIEQPTQGYIEMNGKRVAIKPKFNPTQIQPQQSVTCTQTQKVNAPPTNTLRRQIGIYVFEDANGNHLITQINDSISRRMDTRPNAPLIEKNINTTNGTITAQIEWKESMPNPPEIKSTVNEIIDMSQNVDSTQKERIEKFLAKMKRNPERETETMTRVVHDIQNKPEPISVESNQECFSRS